MLTSLALAAYVALSLLPAGVALCFGGGHDWTAMVAAGCERGALDRDLERALPCGGCAHHEAEHSEPCTDVPLDHDDISLRSWDRSPGRMPMLAAPAFLWSAVHAGPGGKAGAARAAAARSNPVPAGGPDEVRASVRATVLLL